MNRFSYKNVYNSEKHKEFIDSQRYVIDDKFLYKTENYELSNGFSVECSIYRDGEQRENYFAETAFVNKITIKNADKIIHQYYCCDNHHFIFKEIIYHKNGHRYYPFHIDLYGISFLDVDTLEVYNYIPEGYEHDDKYMCGESFIITDVHYDKESNLIAYGGCYWAGLYDTMVGDLSNPLDFNPHLISMRDIFDPDIDFCYEIDFSEWKNGRLFVMCDDGESKTEKSLSIDELKEKINELTERNL
ncbi:MAG: hypothetical protein K2I06_03685 [Ruminococcus sp.]|nr:hypothetical protein [Ruminococcus sp.]